MAPRKYGGGVLPHDLLTNPKDPTMEKVLVTRLQRSLAPKHGPYHGDWHKHKGIISSITILPLPSKHHLIARPKPLFTALDPSELHS
jgi:hypothetical protein